MAVSDCLVALCRLFVVLILENLVNSCDVYIFYNGKPHIYRVGGREGKLNAIIIFYVYRNNGIVLLCLELFQGMGSLAFNKISKVNKTKNMV